MTKWNEPGRWLLIAALAAHSAGCAQTSQWVNRIAGRDDIETTAEVDGLDDLAVKSREKVRIASEVDAKPKSARTREEKPQPEESPRIAANAKRRTTIAQPSNEATVHSSESHGGLRDPFEDSAAQEAAPSWWTASSFLRKRRTAINDEAKAADRDREIAAKAENETMDEVTTASAVVDDSIARKLAQLRPSQASFTQICPAATGDVRELVQSLDDDSVEIIKRSLHRLGRIGPDAAAALPAISCFLTNDDGYVRVHAALAMCRIEGMSSIALKSLTTELSSSESGLRSFAAAVLAELAPDCNDATPALAEALNDPDVYVRLHVAEVLIRDVRWSEDSLAVLLMCLAHRDENVRWLTAYSLAELAPQSPDAVDALAARLDDPSPKVRIGVAYALGEIGQLSHPALVDLQRHAGDRNLELRTAVAYAVEQITGENRGE